MRQIPFAFMGAGAVAEREYDASSTAFFTATGITNTGLKNAVDDLVLGLKSNSLWSKMMCIYPFVTDTSTSADALDDFKYNLVNTGSYTITWVNGTSQTQNQNGFQGAAATNTRGRTGLIPSTALGSLTANYHLSMYTTTGVESSNVIDCGGNSGANQTNIYLGRTYLGTPASVLSLRGNAEIVATSQASYVGHFVGRIDNSLNPVHRLSRQGTQIAGSNTVGNNCGSAELYIGAANQAGSPDAHATKRYQFFSFGNSLTDAEISTFSTLVNDFQDAVDAVLGTSRGV